MYRCVCVLCAFETIRILNIIKKERECITEGKVVMPTNGKFKIHEKKLSEAYRVNGIIIILSIFSPSFTFKNIIFLKQ